MDFWIPVCEALEKKIHSFYADFSPYPGAVKGHMVSVRQKHRTEKFAVGADFVSKAVIILSLIFGWGV